MKRVRFNRVLLTLLLGFVCIQTGLSQSFTSSNLPVIVINTNGAGIPDEPKITADMGIIDKFNYNQLSPRVAVVQKITPHLNLKMMTGDYTVSLSSKLISKFENKKDNVQYYIALEKSSTYGE